MHLVESGGRRILLDCGLFRGPRTEVRPRNRDFPFDPHTVDAVVLSHAHMDHCGNLPNLVRQGFAGPIYCTRATRDLVALMLSDSGRVHEEDSRVLSIVGHPGGARVPPLYTRQDAHRTILQCITLPYGQLAEVVPDVQVRLTDAGHILGSAMVTLIVAAAGPERSLTFTGDLGRHGLPFLHSPAPVPAADLLISESTYGGRVHEPVGRMAETVRAVVHRTAERGGKVLIPAFSLGRTQLVVYYLRRWMADGWLPRLPLYVDSPLAADIAEVYRHYPECFTAEAVGHLGPDAGLAEGPAVHYVRAAEESKELAGRREPCVIVASGGMCEGGRIVQHLRHHIDDPRVSIVLVSYQAPHSLGHRLLERGPTVRFHGRTWNKWADVVEVPGFSGHADQNDFLASFGPLAGRVKKVRLVHGEVERAEALAGGLRAAGFADVAAPAREESVSLA
jgi:metallo-beta-lactamase family protein